MFPHEDSSSARDITETDSKEQSVHNTQADRNHSSGHTQLKSDSDQANISN